MSRTRAQSPFHKHVEDGPVMAADVEVEEIGDAPEPDGGALGILRPAEPTLVHDAETVLGLGVVGLGERQPGRIGAGMVACGEAVLAGREVGDRRPTEGEEQRRREEKSPHRLSVSEGGLTKSCLHVR